MDLTLLPLILSILSTAQLKYAQMMADGKVEIAEIADFARAEFDKAIKLAEKIAHKDLMNDEKAIAAGTKMIDGLIEFIEAQNK